MGVKSGPKIERIETRIYQVPTDRPESDGTLAWDSTTMVLVRARGGGEWGMGYTYADGAAAEVIQHMLAPHIQGQCAMDIPACWSAMQTAIRNNGNSGLAAMAAAAVDSALWDLKARLLGVPLAGLLGMARPRVPVYGSGGFTSYSNEELREQLGGWVAEGIPRVKMKIGRDPQADPKRVGAARDAIGPGAQLFVDANGAYSRKQALAMAEAFRQEGVSWFEEPVWRTDLEGLRMMRDRAPAGMEITVGEYGFEATYFRRLLEAGAVDVLQADATRCGVTGFMQVAALCEAFEIPLSSHCAPALHLHLGCAARPLRHMEYFHDHVRIERMLFDGAVQPAQGAMAPDLTRPGMGLELKQADAQRYAA